MQRNMNWTDEQWQIVEQQAEAAGMAPGDYIRHKATQPDLDPTVVVRLIHIARGIKRPLHFVQERILSDWLARDFADAMVNADAPKVYFEFTDMEGDALTWLTRVHLEDLRRKCAENDAAIATATIGLDA